jgi:hypothetical protein
MNQLKLYEEMGKAVDKSSKIFKQFRLELLANQIQGIYIYIYVSNWMYQQTDLIL